MRKSIYVGVLCMCLFFPGGGGGAAAPGQAAAEQERAIAGSYLIRIDVGGLEPVLLLASFSADGTFHGSSGGSRISLRGKGEAAFDVGGQQYGSWFRTGPDEIEFASLTLSDKQAEGAGAADLRSGIVRITGFAVLSEDGEEISGELSQEFHLADEPDAIDLRALPVDSSGPFYFTGFRIRGEFQGQAKQDICHVDGKGRIRRINVAAPSVPAHLAHGDFEVPTFFEDADGDGFGDPDASVMECELPTGFVENDEDCDDDNDAINPDAADAVCDGVDDNCSGTPDDEFVITDTDCGVGECASTGLLSCEAGDLVDSCAQGDPSPEVCDGLDNDCNGSADDGIAPVPTDCGVGECASTGLLSCEAGDLVDSCEAGPASAEVCDNVDNNCDGSVDEDEVCQGGSCGEGAVCPCAYAVPFSVWVEGCGGLVCESGRTIFRQVEFCAGVRGHGLFACDGVQFCASPTCFKTESAVITEFSQNLTADELCACSRDVIDYVSRLKEARPALTIGGTPPSMCVPISSP